MTRLSALAACLLSLLALSAFGCGAGTSTTTTSTTTRSNPAANYAEFKQRLDASATCAELFEVRNSVDPKSPDIARMNEALRGIGCNSVGSVRSTATPSVGSARSDDTQKTEPVAGFTVTEYRMYRAVVTTPMSVSEQQALQNISTRYGTPVEDVRKAADKVQKLLFQNKWLGTPESEIRHASDWKGETP